ncbi:MAG: RDD family protein [Janthinobacterium lividum]
MSSAVQMEEADESVWQATGTEGAPNLKQVAAERLAAHRNRRASVAAQEAELEIRTRQRREALHHAAREDQRRGASVVRDTVKARYERRESYREFLAAEAERAIAQAQAEAEVAARSARAVTQAQMQLLQELDSLNLPEPGPREEAFAQVQAEVRGELAHALADIVMGAKELLAEPPLLSIVETPALPHLEIHEVRQEPAIREISASGLTVRLFEDIPVSVPKRSELHARYGAEHLSASRGFVETDFEALDEEIAFRHAPEFPVAAVEAQSIPGNLIEFPRELVAPRRARPRLAEGPLFDEPEEPQLRIFEVDAFQLAPEPEVVDPHAMPEWQSMMLESEPMEPSMPPVDAQTQITLPPDTAPIERRLMSAAVDGCLIGAAWLGFAAAVVYTCGAGIGALTVPMLAAATVASLGLFTVLYQMLFFTLSESTPGMRWARIGLCTFGDGNPTRRAMRRRIFSTLLAACPLGLGLAWVWMDNDGMGWHDRMSRMYQRAY